MSRTFRRFGKNKQHNKQSYIQDWKWDYDAGVYVDITPKKGTPAYNKRSAWYHSDAGPAWSVPAAFRYIVRDRKYRSKANAELRRVIKNPEHEVMIPKHHRDAGMYYW